MNAQQGPPIDALIVAVSETAGSALYGMLDVLAATGSLWQQLVGSESPRQLIRPRIVSDRRRPFLCGNNIPVRPDCCIADDPHADLIILPELWLGPDEEIGGRYDAIVEWVRQRYRDGASIYRCHWQNAGLGGKRTSAGPEHLSIAGRSQSAPSSE